MPKNVNYRVTFLIINIIAMFSRIQLLAKKRDKITLLAQHITYTDKRKFQANLNIYEKS